MSVHQRNRQKLLGYAVAIEDHCRLFPFAFARLGRSAGALCAVLSPAGPVWDLLGQPGGGNVLVVTARVLVAVLDRLTAPHMMVASATLWSDEAGALLEQVAVGLLDFAHAPGHGAMLLAAFNTARLAWHRVELLGCAFAHQLAGMTDTTELALFSLELRDDRGRRSAKELRALLRTALYRIRSLRRGPLRRLTRESEAALGRWITDFYAVLVAAVRRPSYFTPAGLGSDAPPIVARLTQLLTDVPKPVAASLVASLESPTSPTWSDSGSAAAGLVDGAAERKEPPPPYELAWEVSAAVAPTWYPPSHPPAV